MQMEWLIPSKTFLLGEYAAIADGSAILLTTTPCFKITLSQHPGLHGIHEESPAGRWWADTRHRDHYGLQWHDPYHGLGGMGASSAQFLGAYWASSYLNHQQPAHKQMLEAYWQYAWNGQGLRPSAYDLMAQSLSGCVHINRAKALCEITSWPFNDIDFMLVHTGNKIATHHHLQQSSTIQSVELFNQIVNRAKRAFELADGLLLAEAIEDYYQALFDHDLVHMETQRLITHLKGQEGILAAKGCGALGADVVLLLIASNALSRVSSCLKAMNLPVLATSRQLFVSS